VPSTSTPDSGGKDEMQILSPGPSVRHREATEDRFPWKPAWTQYCLEIECGTDLKRDRAAVRGGRTRYPGLAHWYIRWPALLPADPAVPQAIP